MDDYNVSVLSEAKNEYSLRLVTILFPLVLEGVKSILKEAWELCLTNDEEEKYLMTFQNFLSRVTKWNQTIIDEETERILSKSGCPYLEDLLTCVHITQLKILTSIRVSQKQKKIELDVPKLSDFVHKIYIKCARKFYSNVYLFEQKIMPLQYQKNMRECETICKECILNVIRDNMPVEHILRSYMDESIEEEIIEEIVPQESSESKETPIDISQNAVSTEKDVKKEVEVKKTEEEKQNESPKEVLADSSSTILSVNTEVANTPPKIEQLPLPPKPVERILTEHRPVSPKLVAPVVPVITAPSPITTPKSLPDTPSPPIIESNTPKMTKSLSFNDVDKVFDHDTLKENLVSAPKNIERLEQISAMRTAQRKAEEAEEDASEENIKIHTEDANIQLDIQQL